MLLIINTDNERVAICLPIKTTEMTGQKSKPLIKAIGNYRFSTLDQVLDQRYDALRKEMERIGRTREEITTQRQHD